jgi:hypothetical protein
MAEWNKYELTEFFGVLPEEDEDRTYLSFRVEKGSLRLNVTFYHYAGDVYIDLVQDGANGPVFRTIIENSAGAKYVRASNGYECLEISDSEEQANVGKERLAPMKVRLGVNPQIGIELLPRRAG